MELNCKINDALFNYFTSQNYMMLSTYLFFSKEEFLFFLLDKPATKNQICTN